MRTVTPEEQGLIDAVELAVDWNLPVPEEEYNQYLELTDSE
ncbi:MAG: hypothetical protein UGF89_07720 [Acutalibacteraceae bacterium]|nr:hypothetical protein [Acutalibacteraceae bacterium]